MQRKKEKEKVMKDEILLENDVIEYVENNKNYTIIKCSDKKKFKKLINEMIVKGCLEKKRLVKQIRYFKYAEITYWEENENG